MNLTSPTVLIRLRIAMVGVAVAAGVVPSLSGTVIAGASSSSLCQKVTAAEVGAALGVKVTKVTRDVNGGVTVCWYQVGHVAHAAYVRSQTQVTSAGFKSDEALAKSYGENPTIDNGFKPYAAFSTSVRSPAYGFTYSVTILKKSTQLDVGGSSSTLAKVEGLAKKVLPLL